MPPTVKLTGPFPLPELPPVIVIQGALLVAVQAQLAPAVTVVVPLPPAAPKFCDVGEIEKAATLKADEKKKLTEAAHRRLARGFRDNTWYLQTRGSHYDLAPKAARKVAVVRTIYAEADGVPYPEPDPANPKLRAFSWMTAHSYEADREVARPFDDWRTLQIPPAPEEK